MQPIHERMLKDANAERKRRCADFARMLDSYGFPVPFIDEPTETPPPTDDVTPAPVEDGPGAVTYDELLALVNAQAAEITRLNQITNAQANEISELAASKQTLLYDAREKLYRYREALRELDYSFIPRFLLPQDVQYRILHPLYME